MEQQSALLNDEGKAGLEDLRQIFALCQSTSAGPHLSLDRSLARGLSYYTGPIFEIRVADLAGSLGGGGRYDDLIGMFSGENVPACGISLGLERILVVMGERNMFPEAVVSTPADVMVVSGSRTAPVSTCRWRPSCAAPDCASSSIRMRRSKTTRRVRRQAVQVCVRRAAFHSSAVIGDDELASGYRDDSRTLATRQDEQTIARHRGARSSSRRL